MNAVRRLRRAPRLTIALTAVVAVSIAAAVAWGATPAIQTITPNTDGPDDEHRRRAGSRPRTTTARRLAVAGSGSTATWSDAAEPSTATTRTRRESVASKGESWLHARSKVREPSDRARRRRHDADDLELRALQQLGLQRGHERQLRRPDDGAYGTTFTGNMFPATPGMVDLVNQAKAMGYADLLDHRAGRLAARRRRSPTSQSDTAAGLPDITSVTCSGYDRPGDRRRLPGADAARHRPRRLHRRPVHQAAGRLVSGLPEPAAVLRADAIAAKASVPDDPVQVRARAPTSSRRATTSSPTSATSSAT